MEELIICMAFALVVLASGWKTAFTFLGIMAGLWIVINIIMLILAYWVKK